MKRVPIFKLLLIIFLSISITLSGCSSKKKEIDEPTNIEEEQGTNDEEMAEDDKIEESKIDDEIEEEEIEKEEENNEKIEESSDNKEKATEGKDTSKGLENNKGTKRDIKEETKEEIKDEPVEEAGDRLKVEGSVGKELALSLDELKAMDKLIFKGEYYSINNFGTTRHTEFKGINLWSLLKQEAQISSNATKVTIVAIDGYKMEFTIDQVKRQDYIDETKADAKFPMIIAWEENGEEYDPEEGPPFKLVIGQKEPGDVNKPQWVSNIDKIIVK